MEEIVPTEFQLSQNYPNPFRRRTTIKYCISEKTRVIIEIYDAGRTNVKTIVREIKDAGAYKVDFNAAKLDSGIYFCRLRAGPFIETKKMILMK